MSMGSREDYAYPFQIDPWTGRAAQSDYPTHIDQMIRQLLLTDPGERSDLPNFGCGLRRALFKPLTGGLEASGQILVRQALDQWLAGVIHVEDVTVDSSERQRPDGSKNPLESGTLLITITYTLLDTLATAVTEVRLI
jgi:phage baseplate assembly protein W